MMKNRKLWIPVSITCILLLMVAGEGLGALALPFVLVAKGLRWLSLSGPVGNLVAIVLYSLVCLSPLVLVRKRREDWLLVLCAGILFYVMYGFINPGTLPAVLNNQVGQLIYAGVVYNILIAWGVVRLLKASDSMGISNIYSALRIFLTICGLGLVLLGTVGGFFELRQTITDIQNANTMPGLDLMPTYAFVTLGWIADAGECCLDAVVILWGIRLIREVEVDPYSEACTKVGEKLTQWCKWALRVIVLGNMALNLGQVLFASALHNIDASVRIPVFSIGLVFCTLVLNRLLNQGKEIKDDNDLFV